MHYITTALGRLVPEQEIGTAFQDLVLKVLFDYRTSPFNSDNVPMTLSALAKTTRATDEKALKAIADSLVKAQPPLLERVPFQGQDAYRITGSGLVFVQNVPPVLASLT